MGKGRGVKHSGAAHFRSRRKGVHEAMLTKEEMQKESTATQAISIPREVSDWFDVGRIRMMQHIEERSVCVEGCCVRHFLICLAHDHEATSPLLGEALCLQDSNFDDMSSGWIDNKNER